jgi:deoxycytidine triphosphate deaminase
VSELPLANQGGVLTDGEIARLSPESGTPLISSLMVEHLRPAGYDVRIAKDELVAPDGKRFAPGTDYTEVVLTLEPGDTAELTSFETLTLPKNIAGTVTVKTHLARQGLLLLTGNIIDPTFNGRLHFYVANVGARSIDLYPGDSRMASVQFSYTAGQAHDKRRQVERQQPARNLSLGFLAVLRDIKDGYADMKAKVERNSEITDNVLMLGYFVLAATLLSMSLDHLLSLAGDDKLVDRVNRAVPDTTDGKVLLGTFLVSVAWIVHSLAVVLPHRRRKAPEILEDLVFYRREAILEARRLRAFRWMAGGAAFVCVGWLFAFVVTQLNWSGWAWVAPPAASLMGLALAWLILTKVTTPLTETNIAARANELLEQKAPPVDSSGTYKSGGAAVPPPTG